MQNYVLGKARDQKALCATRGHRAVRLRWMKGGLKALPRGAWLSHVLSMAGGGEGSPTEALGHTNATGKPPTCRPGKSVAECELPTSPASGSLCPLCLRSWWKDANAGVQPRKALLPQVPAGGGPAQAPGRGLTPFSPEPGLLLPGLLLWESD